MCLKCEKCCLSKTTKRVLNNQVKSRIILLEFGYTLLDSFIKKKKKNILLLYGIRFGCTFRWKFSAINDIPEKEKEMMPLKMVWFSSKRFTRDRLWCRLAEDWTSISIFNHDSSYFYFFFFWLLRKMTQANWFVFLSIKFWVMLLTCQKATTISQYFYFSMSKKCNLEML